MKTYRDILNEAKDWTTKVGGGAGKDWKIKKSWIDSNGDVFIEFNTPNGKSTMSAGSGAKKGWKIKKAWIDKSGDVFVTFNI